MKGPGRVANATGIGPSEDDWNLWARACAGHEPSAARIVSRLMPQALGIARQLTRRREDAEDAVQESFLRLWRSDASPDRGSRLSTYFNAIVINRCRTRLAARTDLAVDQDALHAMLDTDQASHGADEPAHGMAGLSGAGAADRLRNALAALPARQRMAVAMWAYADADVDDIARALELKPNAVHQLLHRGRRALRTALEGDVQ